MTIHGSSKIANANAQAKDPNASLIDLFDPSFMGSLGPALPYLQQNNVKVAVNAGASAPGLLAKTVKDEVTKQGLNLKVAWVEGDDVTQQVNELRKKGEKFKSIDTGKDLDEWGHEPLCAQYVSLSPTLSHHPFMPLFPVHWHIKPFPTAPFMGEGLVVFPYFKLR